LHFNRRNVQKKSLHPFVRQKERKGKEDDKSTKEGNNFGKGEPDPFKKKRDLSWIKNDVVG
jgi:hypothetical protein